jgi:hypothetical protein
MPCGSEKVEALKRALAESNSLGLAGPEGHRRDKTQTGLVGFALNGASLLGLLHTALAAANFAASGIDSLAGLRWLLDDFKTGAVTRFAFDFAF